MPENDDLQQAEPTPQNLAQNPQNPSKNQNPQSPLAKNDDKGGASISTGENAGEKAGLSGGQVALKQSAGSYGKIDMR